MRGGKGQGWVAAHGQGASAWAKRKANGRVKQRKKKFWVGKAHCRKMWPLDDNMPAGRQVGQACFFLKPCSYLIIHDNQGSVKHLKNAKFTSKHQQADYGVTLRTNWKKQTHRLRPLLFTYYELPFTKDTLLSLCPLEDCGCAGLEATCLTRQPGE